MRAGHAATRPRQKKGRLFHTRRRQRCVECSILGISVTSPYRDAGPPIFRRGWLALSAERNADGYRLQCLTRALVCATLFVIALRKRLTLVDRHAGRDHPPLIGNGLRDPIADETLAGLVLSGDAIAASSGLGLIMLVVIPVGIAGLLPYERSSLLGSSHRVSPGLLAPRSQLAVVRQHGRRTHFGES